MRLTLGLSDTARTRPLAAGRVAIPGVEADITLMGVQELFNHQLAEHTFDVAEFPLATYLRSLERPERPYLAVPVFPSRHFRLSSLFASEKSDVRTPADLAGRRIGISVFDMAAGMWLRGILHDHFGLDRHAPTYVIGGLEGPRSGDEHPQLYPPGFRFEHRTDAGLAELLAAGEIDALMTARAPSTWPDGGVRRLLPDAREAERAYYRSTGIFPAMHVLVVKRPLAEQHPELPWALHQAFTQSVELARSDLADAAALDTLLPWQLDDLLDAERLLGADFWASGLRANSAMLARAIDYCLADGLITTPFTPEDLFRGPGDHRVLTS
ncbi:4,5-dihydroxyphthalate decarboxylase [Nocardioides sp. 616]|uniref:4,5-dihydroxyphthalate decarboxylase n=1 Tax=Nocardioides sp. 616 TaxID=2268090 RepID=UPI000CE31CFE|nr:4,5-dihydroxyphthalate decarboxylase [Nocardioides sp. 616]